MAMMILLLLLFSQLATIREHFLSSALGARTISADDRDKLPRRKNLHMIPNHLPYTYLSSFFFVFLAKKQISHRVLLFFALTWQYLLPFFFARLLACLLFLSLCSPPFFFPHSPSFFPEILTTYRSLQSAAVLLGNRVFYV